MALTAQQIVALSTQIAGAPGFVQQAGQLLNMILSDLCQTYDLAVAQTVTTITLGATSGPYPLPSDYLRNVGEDDVWFTYNGVKYPLVPIDYAEYTLLVQQPGMNSLPSQFATDMTVSPPNLFVWPPPNGAYPLTIRYQRQMPDIATPETSAVVPWFPNQAYLKTRLAGEVMQITDDERASAFLGESDTGAQGLLKRYLNLKDDRTNRAETVKLDRRTFGPVFNKLPNTKTIGW